MEFKTGDLEYLLKIGHGMIRLPKYEGEPVENRWEPSPTYKRNPNPKRIRKN